MRRESIEVARDVHVLTSTRYTTTSTIVRSGDRCLLVDPAWTVSELDAIRDWLAERACTVASGFSTHAHHDHLLWHPDYGDVPRYASAATVRLAGEEWHDELRGQLDDDYRDGFPDSFVGLVPVDGELLRPFGVLDEHVELIVHDGHAPGHTALWFGERGVLLAGDMLSDVELPLPFHPDDLGAYLAALDELAPVVAKAHTLVPGHGHVTDRPLERLDADRRYLDAVLSGDEPDDPRRANAEMDDAHRRIVGLARGLHG